MISVVVPCHDERSYIGRLLASLDRQSADKGTFEVIVVDNASGDDTCAQVRAFSARSKLQLALVTEPALGVSRAKNRGASAARYDLLVFLDADIVVGKAFIAAVGAAFRDPSIGAATLQTRAEPSDAIGPVVFWILDLIKRRLPRPFGKSAVRKKLFLQVGGYDPVIVLGENVEFLMKIKAACLRDGKRLVHLPAVITCSLRRFRRDGYIPVLSRWLLAYLGHWTLQYETMGGSQ